MLPFVVYTVYVFDMLGAMNCILYGIAMRTAQQLLTLFATLLLLLLLLFIVIYIWLCWFVRRNYHNGLVCRTMIRVGCVNLLSNLLSCICICQSVPPEYFLYTIIPPTYTLLFRPYTYNWMMLLTVLYDRVVLVRMTWYTDDSVTTIRDDDVMALPEYCMSGAMNNVLPDGNNTNDVNTTIYSSSI